MDGRGRDRTRWRVGRETVEPDRLPRPERDAFLKDLYAVHSLIFSGISEEEFNHHVVESPAVRTLIQVYSGRGGGIVGYCAFHKFVRSVQGRDVIVIRAEAGLLPDYRGHGVAHWFGMVRALLEKLLHPLTPVYYFGTLVHPSSYRFFCKYFPRVYPHPQKGMPDAIRALAIELANSFADPAVDPEDQFIRDVGWVTIERSGERQRNHAAEHDDVRYFKSQNPGYRSGDGMVVVVPVTFLNVFRAMLRRAIVVSSQRLGFS